MCVCVCVWGGGGGVEGDGTAQNFGPICVIIQKMNLISDKVQIGDKVGK